MKDDLYQHIVDCVIGKNTRLHRFINLYGCVIGDNCMVGTFVEIQKGVKIGKKVRVQSHSFICEGVTIGDEVFVGHHVVFTNDKYPKATNSKGKAIRPIDWKLLPVVIGKGASIGSNATILGGVTIGKNSLIGAGSVVTHDVPPFAIVAGNPARIIGKVKDK